MPRGVLAVAVILLLCACGSDSAPAAGGDPPSATPDAMAATTVPATLPLPTATTAPSPTSTPPPATYELEYRAVQRVNRPITIVWLNATGGENQTRTQGNNWTESYTVEDGFEASLSVTNIEYFGHVRCEIYIDGELWREAEADGHGATATCSGRVEGDS